MSKNKLVPSFNNLKEKLDPTPVASRVAFRKPLSAHERVLRAIKTHEMLKGLESNPGDESFDEPDIDNMAIHQLMVDPQSGEEMTAGEYVMLQNERAQAKLDVEKVRRQHAQSAKPQKKRMVKGKTAAKGEGEESTEPVESDESDET